MRLLGVLRRGGKRWGSANVHNKRAAWESSPANDRGGG